MHIVQVLSQVSESNVVTQDPMDIAIILLFIAIFARVYVLYFKKMNGDTDVVELYSELNWKRNKKYNVFK